MNFLRLKNYTYFRSTPFLTCLLVIVVTSFGFVMATSHAGTNINKDISPKPVSSTKALTSDSKTSNTAKDLVGNSTPIDTSQPSDNIDSTTTASTPATQTINKVPSTTKSTTPQSLSCPYLDAPSNMGDIGSIPKNIYAPEGAEVVKGSTSPITISTANNITAVMTLETGSSNSVYVTSNNTPGTYASTFTFQIIAQSDVTLGQVYWVYINFLFQDGTTATYSLPVSIVCY